MEEYFTAHSASLIFKNLVSDKIILHCDVFAKTYNLSTKNEVFIWELYNTSNSKITHCTVLEYTSDDYKKAYLPKHMMIDLDIPEGGKIKLNLITDAISKAEKILLQPFQSSFFKLNAYKEILENSLKNYCVVTEGDIINIDTFYNTEKLVVKQINPCGYVGIIMNTNLEVEFENAVFENKEKEEKKETSSSSQHRVIQFQEHNYKEEQLFSDESPDPNIKKCQNCNTYISQKNLSLHEVHCYKNIKLCNICKTGINYKNITDHLHCAVCKMVVTTKTIEEHYDLYHKKTNCIYCNKEFTNSELDEHVIKCEYLPTSCLYCKINIPFVNLNSHEIVCGSKTVECEVCNKSILLRNIRNHNSQEHNITD